jgi:hypothetical protein
VVLFFVHIDVFQISRDRFQKNANIFRVGSGADDSLSRGRQRSDDLAESERTVANFA